MEQKQQHPIYQIVTDSKEADACAWGFYEFDLAKIQKIYFKFPSIKDDEVRINVTYTGICQSDVSEIKTPFWPHTALPYVPGHEITGEVTHVGSKVSGFKVGDKVGFGPRRNFCGDCHSCKLGNDQLCSTPSAGPHFTIEGPNFGGFATAYQAPASMCFHLPTEFDEEKYPPILCGGITSYSPVAKYCKPGQNVGVIGIGGVGHLAVKFAKAFGCNVTSFTTSKDKVDLLKKLGSDKVVITTEEGALEKEAGLYDVLLITSSNFNADEFNSYFKLMGPGGVWAQLGLSDFSKTIPFSLVFHLLVGEKTFAGSVAGSKKANEEMIEFTHEKNIVPICENYEFEDFPKAWEKVAHGKPFFRCVVKCKDYFKKGGK